ncbi:MAG: tRNA lysidine(34) synthetase TilS [Maribacter sp.]
MLFEFKKNIQKHFPELLQEKFLLACSGGLDSVVLTQLCSQCEMDFAIAHCNFKLRGNDSDADEVFVRNLAFSLNKEFIVTHFDTKSYAAKHKMSVQMAARELRYQWFEDLMLENNIKTLVTAHHADDNLETFIINLSRGTGIKGLIGIPSRTDTILRPLLTFSRDQISVFAKSGNIEWREDVSNAETKYLRNKIRHQIVPLLKELHPTFLDNFSTTQKYLSQTEAISENHLHHIKESLFVIDGDIIRIGIDSLSNLEPLDAYIYGLFKEYGFTEWEDVRSLLTAMSGKEVHSRTHRLVKDRDFLLLAQNTSLNEHSYQIKESDTQIHTPINLSMCSVDDLEETNTNTLYVDKETLKYPMTLRKWQKGDYFYPLGMKGRKKLSKYFKDEKIDVIAKEKQWLLCSDNQVVWIVGKRADERFKVTDNTKNILKIMFNS